VEDTGGPVVHKMRVFECLNPIILWMKLVPVPLPPRSAARSLPAATRHTARPGRYGMEWSIGITLRSLLHQCHGHSRVRHICTGAANCSLQCGAVDMPARASLYARGTS